MIIVTQGYDQVRADIKCIVNENNIELCTKHQELTTMKATGILATMLQRLNNLPTSI